MSRLLAYLERTFTSAGKILIAFGVIVSAVTATASAIMVLDSRYVHYEAYASDVLNINGRLDRADLRVLEGQLRTVSGQILDLERLKTLTAAELAFLKQLRNDRERLEADIREIRSIIQDQARKSGPGRGR